MTERPILFSGPMVRAILAGRKTQTRRLVKPQPEQGIWKCGRSCLALGNAPPPPDGYERWCPYGLPGDRLWVRECWRELGSGQGADGKIPTYPVPVGYAADRGYSGPWRPSIHMPRWASRLTLEVVGVRVERLHDISEADAQAEGCAPMLTHADPSAREQFESLWDSINGKRATWASNPWVWVVTFRRLEAR